MLLPHLKLFDVLFEMRCILLTSSVGENSIKKTISMFTLLSRHLLVFVLTKSPILASMGCFCDTERLQLQWLPLGF